MKHLGLFEGIGGFSLAARWAGWETVAWCEWNEFGQRVLRYHFPEAEGFGDITKTDFKKYAGKINVLTGGFPCQPYSTAGKRKGKEDERHLWPQMLRAIREIRPRWVVGENVRGLINWNGGLVFDEIQSDLEAIGYEILPFEIPAGAKALFQIRDRVWIVAHYNSQQPQPEIKKSNNKQLWGEITRGAYKTWLEAATSLCRLDDGLSTRLDGITLSKWRKESIKAYGNAVVPQVVYEIFKAINEYENNRNH